MRAMPGTAAILFLLTATAHAQIAISPRYAPYRSEKTEKRLAELFKDTQPFLTFRDNAAKPLWNSMYVDCAAFGIDDRYIFYDTMFRETLLLLRAMSDDPMGYLEIHSTPNGIAVDSVLPPYKQRLTTTTMRLAVIDRSGRFVFSELTEQGAHDACYGSQGDIYVDGKRLMAGPPH